MASNPVFALRVGGPTILRAERASHRARVERVRQGVGGMAETGTRRWTIADLESLPDEPGTRYEIINGELFVTRQPHFGHQECGGKCVTALNNWNAQAGLVDHHE